MKDPEEIDQNIANNYKSGRYWNNRMDLMYYSYVDYIVRTVARDANSMIDVGTAQCPYLEWFDWIEKKVSFDIVDPYRSKTVEGVQGDLLSHDFKGASFDVVTCLQVLEHVPDAKTFARKLFDLGKTVIISVPYKWPKSAADDHVHDPVDEKKLERWTDQKPNFQQVIQEPFRGKVGRRLIAVYEDGRSTGYGRKDFKDRIRRARFPMP